MKASDPIIVTAALSPADLGWATALRERFFPPERNYLRAHVTLFHALPPSAEDEVLRTLDSIAREHRRPAARIDGLLNLGRGVALHVDSPALAAVREELAERFSGLLTAQDQARPRLHITIQNKVEARRARETLAALTAELPLPRPLTITGLEAHFYRGGPWEPIRRWAFRG